MTVNIKASWISDFEKLLLKNEPDLNNNNPNYSCQLASAYFDWDAEGNLPECVVEEAYQRYLMNNSQDKASKLSRILGLPYWFDPATCVIVINSEHKEQFKGYNVEWLVFSDYIMYGEMIVLDKTNPFTPITEYRQGVQNDSLYKKPI